MSCYNVMFWHHLVAIIICRLKKVHFRYLLLYVARVLRSYDKKNARNNVFLYLFQCFAFIM